MADESKFHRTVRLMYTGHSERARQFRYGLITFDALSISPSVRQCCCASTSVGAMMAV